MPTISKIKDKTNDIIYDIEDAKAREDISDLRSQISALTSTESPTWEQGWISIATGDLSDSTTRCRTEKFSLKKGFSMTITPNGMDYNFGIYHTDSTFNIYSGVWVTDGNALTISFDEDVSIIVGVKKTDNTAITPSDVTASVIYGYDAIADLSNGLAHEVDRSKNVESGLANGIIQTTVTGGFTLGGTGNGSLIIDSTTDMITRTVQSVDRECVLTTDWTKYRIFVWEYSDNTWNSLGWKYADIELDAGFNGRFVIRGLTIHSLTEAEQAEINNVTVYKSDTQINKRVSFLEVEAQRKTGDFISICHQGYSDTLSIGENLLSGYQLAKEKGFEYGECDVVLSSDNVVMCCHDTSFVDQTTQETIVIGDHTAAELKTYNYYGGTIATLDEIMNACKVNGIGLVIDHATNAILPYIFPIVKKYGMQKRVIYLIGWASGNPNYANNMYSSVLSFYSKSEVMFMANTSNINEVLAYVNALTVGNNRVYITLNHSNFSVSDIQSIIESLNGEISLAVWTIDTLATCKQYLPYVTAITSNKFSSADIFD